jgi:sporulation protein YlmC with PRC-barrel domain
MAELSGMLLNVLLLSEIVGMEVRGPDGTSVGRVADMTVVLGDHEGSAVVDRVLVRPRRGHDLLFTWSTVQHMGRDGVLVSSGGIPSPSIADSLAVDEILLRRDVLDTQIVDIAGQRLTRVADVVLARRRDGRLHIIGVEVGFGAVLRRLRVKRLAARANSDAVAWSDLHLTSARGHAVQLGTPRSAVHLLDARGLASLVSRLDVESAAEVLKVKGPGVAAEVIRASDAALGERVLRAMTDAEAADVVAAMPARHASIWRHVLAQPRLSRGRPLMRSRVWPRRRAVGRSRE